MSEVLVAWLAATARTMQYNPGTPSVPGAYRPLLSLLHRDTCTWWVTTTDAEWWLLLVHDSWSLPPLTLDAKTADERERKMNQTHESAKQTVLIATPLNLQVSRDASWIADRTEWCSRPYTAHRKRMYDAPKCQHKFTRFGARCVWKSLQVIEISSFLGRLKVQKLKTRDQT